MLAAALEPPFDAAAADAVQVYVDQIGADLDSIYVTGSVARGMARPGESDLNMIAVTGELVDPDLVRQQWIDNAERELAARHPALRAVELDLWPYFYVFDDPAYFSIGAFILKTHSRCLWGSDLALSLPDYRVTPAIANDDLLRLTDDIADALEDIRADASAENAAYWCRRVARAVVYSGFGLVQMAEGQHTRDLDLCADCFARHDPQHAEAMQQSLALAQQPLQDAEAARRYFDSLAWITALAERWLDDYNPARDEALRVDEVED